jgi:hypothetical protein
MRHPFTQKSCTVQHNSYTSAKLYYLHYYTRYCNTLLSQQDINIRNGLDLTSIPITDFIPISEAFWASFTEIGLTSYNRAFLVPSRQYTQTFSEAIDKAYNEVCILLYSTLHRTVCIVSTVIVFKQY